MTFLFWTALVLFVVICLFMILLVLIQKGRGGGLASAFGGAGGSTAFGSKTGDVLTWATSIVFGIFLLLAIVLNLVATSMNERDFPETAQQTPVAGGAGGAAGSPAPALPPAPVLPPAPTGPGGPAGPR